MLFQFIWLFSMAILGLRLFIPVKDVDIRGLSVWMQALWTIFLFVYVLFTALGVGRKLLGWLTDLSQLEQYLIALILGFAILSNGILILGLISLLNEWGIYCWLAACGLVASFQWQEIASELQTKLRSVLPLKVRPSDPFEYILFVALACFAFLMPIVALAPVKDYDALMYHLQIPRQFLEQGRIYFDPAVWRSTQPMMTEMLFLIGIAFHLDSLAQLISLAFCAVFLLSVYSFAKRFFSAGVGLLAVGILLGNPAFPIYATAPSVEFSWASYEFIALYIFSIWLFDQERKLDRTLIIVGIMSGLAATTKYLSLPTTIILGFIVIIKTHRFGRDDFWSMARNALKFGVPVLVVMAPWYLRNFIWTGNPFYPLFWGGPGWTSLRQELILNNYVGSFGTGTGWVDYLMIPINMYAALSHFSTISFEIFHPLLWIGFSFVLTSNWKKFNYLVWYILLGFMLWMVSMRQIRFLLPLSGVLALLSAKTIFLFPSVIRRGVTIAFIGGMTLVTLISFLSLSSTHFLCQ